MKAFVWSVLIRLENSKCNDPLVWTNIVGSLNNTYASYWFSVNERVLVRVSTSVMETEALTAAHVLDVYRLFLLPCLSFWFCYSVPVLLYLPFCCELSNKWHNLFASRDRELGSSGKTNRERKVLLVKQYQVVLKVSFVLGENTRSTISFVLNANETFYMTTVRRRSKVKTRTFDGLGFTFVST